MIFRLCVCALNYSIGTKEALEHIVVGWLDLVWLILIAIHDHSHAQSKNEYFPKFVGLNQASLHH